MGVMITSSSFLTRLAWFTPTDVVQLEVCLMASGGQKMPGKMLSTDDIAVRLKQVDVLVSPGDAWPERCKRLVGSHWGKV